MFETQLLYLMQSQKEVQLNIVLMGYHIPSLSIGYGAPNFARKKNSLTGGIEPMAPQRFEVPPLPVSRLPAWWTAPGLYERGVNGRKRLHFPRPPHNIKANCFA